MIDTNNNQLLVHPSSQQSIIHGVSHYPPQRTRYQQARLNSATNYRYNSGQNNLPYNSGGNNVPYNPGQNNVPYNSPQISRRYNSAPNNRGYNSPILQAKPYRIVVPHSPLGRPEAAPQQVVYRWHIGGITKCTAKCNGGIMSLVFILIFATILLISYKKYVYHESLNMKSLPKIPWRKVSFFITQPHVML